MQIFNPKLVVKEKDAYLHPTDLVTDNMIQVSPPTHFSLKNGLKNVKIICCA